ncbi:hypothetical protein [Caldivirga maquilingensis]|uniref:Uncharacterized protein n=1 Tax=Caldivirga maquilingensis (strain ATCC 700844 / DSM 13496 / JCM 10307 / IC-167) TaxID=397948 RepID=A8ME90_CALMQ|nr:hypothetical protein [Caldivirga maquilingensis]ABW02096.1 hypothetical protein Cmaq_1269 [Caldivirga maquilingensis IC-167]
MVKGKRRSKEEGKSTAITSFFQPEEPAVKGETKVSEGATVSERGVQLSGVDNEVYEFIKSRGTVSRKELEDWGKVKGLTSAQLFGAVYRLSKLGKITRRIINDQLSYIAH